MAKNLEAALGECWAQAELAEAFAGGLHFDRLPRADATGNRINLPYAIVSHVGQSNTLRTNCSEFGEQRLQLDLYASTKQAVEDLAAAVVSALTAGNWNVDDAHVIEVRRMYEGAQINKLDENLWRGRLQYRIRLQRQR